MKSRRAVAAVAAQVAALALALVAMPVHADGPAVSIGSFSAGWAGATLAGGWAPLTASVKNDGGSEFSGTLSFRDRRTAQYMSPSQVGTYDIPVVVPRASERSFTVYADLTNLPQSGSLEVHLLDTSGAEVAGIRTASIENALAAGVLSGAQNLSAAISQARLHGTESIKAVALDAGSFPRTPLQLSGLSVVVIGGGFDSGSLSQAQLSALQEFAGYGATLVLAGGSGWRHSLGQLPAGFPLPLRPEAGGQASLKPLGELIGRPVDTVAPVAIGRLDPAAGVVLADPAGIPLIIAQEYGAGNVLELAFDPSDDGVRGTVAADLAWNSILSYATRPASPKGFGGGGITVYDSLQSGFAPNGLPGGALAAGVASLLRDTPANALPPIGILGVLLVVYVLLLGPVNYLVLRRARRRELAWISVPLIALVFTGAAYAQGGFSHGSDFYVNEVQLLRVAPDGAVAAGVYDSVFTPRRGDFDVALGDGTLASVAINMAAGTGVSNAADSVMATRSPRVHLRDVAWWTPRNLRTERMAAGAPVLEAHLSLVAGRVVGTIANRGKTAVSALRYVGPQGQAALIERLNPGATATVGGALVQLGYQLGPINYCNSKSPCIATGATGTGTAYCPGPGSCGAAPDGPAAGPPADRRAVATEIAGETMLGRGTLTGLTDPLPAARVAGGVPNRDVIAAFAVSVPLESVDQALGSLTRSMRILAYGSASGRSTLVADFAWPPGYTGKLGLASNGFQGGGRPVAVQAYDWAASTWRTIDLAKGAPLTATERSGPMLRLRIQGDGSVDLRWSAA